MLRLLRSLWCICLFEARMMHADRSLWLVSGALVALVGYGLANGFAHSVDRERTAAAIADGQVKADASNRALLKQIMSGEVVPDPFANPLDPASMGSGLAARYAVLPTPALSPLAFGQSDLNPDYYRVTYRSKATFMYDGEVENPWNLLSGHFDLAFVLTYLFPLLIFAVSYNVVSGERENGTLRMLLSQPLSSGTLVAGKLLPRAAVLLASAVIVPVIAILAARPESRAGNALTELMLWVFVVAAYAAFWFALVVVVNALTRSSAANVLALIGSWVFFVLAAPVLMNLVVAIVAPTASRTELATRTRTVTVAALARYNDLLSTDYKFVSEPGVLISADGRLDVAPRLQGLYLVQRDTDNELEGLLNEFDRQIDRQQVMVDRWAALSPAIVVHEAMTALAGNGTRRYVRFHEQVSRFHARWKAFFEPKVLGGIAITESDLAAMPVFTWEEAAPVEGRAEVAGRLLRVAVPTLLLALWATALLRRRRLV